MVVATHGSMTGLKHIILFSIEFLIIKYFQLSSSIRPTTDDDRRRPTTNDDERRRTTDDRQMTMNSNMQVYMICESRPHVGCQCGRGSCASCACRARAATPRRRHGIEVWQGREPLPAVPTPQLRRVALAATRRVAGRAGPLLVQPRVWCVVAAVLRLSCLRIRPALSGHGRHGQRDAACRLWWAGLLRSVAGG